MIRKPNNLDDSASQFWQRHAKRLQVEGLLTEATFDSFVLLCKTYALLSRLNPDDDPKTGIIKYVALSRVYQQLSKGFAMHSDKVSKPIQAAKKDEYGI